MQENNKLVGGVFGLELNDNPSNFKPPFLYGDNLYLANTRSGIKLLIDNLKLKRCWLPSYLCKSIFLAVECCDIQVSYYPVDQNLSVSDLSFIDEIKSTSQVLYLFFNASSDFSFTWISVLSNVKILFPCYFPISSWSFRPRR